MRVLLVIITLIGASFANANCLNISGTFKVESTAGFPYCAEQEVVARWIKFEQDACSLLRFEYVNKLRNGSFCFNGTDFYFADGKRHPWGGGDQYEYQMLPDRHRIIWYALSGSVGSSERRLDSDGNLVIDTGSGHPKTFLREDVQ